jgi:hypothetical protein
LIKQIDKYHSYKIDISRVLFENDLIIMSKDFEVIDRLFNILTEGGSINKIESIISTTEILKYGGEIEDSKAKSVYLDILEWWETNKLYFFGEPYSNPLV